LTNVEIRIVRKTMEYCTCASIDHA
jgi:hypothetical protein